MRLNRWLLSYIVWNSQYDNCILALLGAFLCELLILNFLKSTSAQTQISGNGSNMCMKRKTNFSVNFRFKWDLV